MRGEGEKAQRGLSIGESGSTALAPKSRVRRTKRKRAAGGQPFLKVYLSDSCGWRRLRGPCPSDSLRETKPEGTRRQSNLSLFTLTSPCARCQLSPLLSSAISYWPLFFFQKITFVFNY